MKNERLLHHVGAIDDRYIAEASPEGGDTAQARPVRKPRLILRYASAAACAVIVITAALLIWRGGGVQITPPVSTAVPPQTNLSSSPAIHSPDSGQTVYPLIINRADAETAGDMHIDGHFWNELTAEQLGAVFPGLPLDLSATAHYSGDGSLVFISAYEVGSDRTGLMFREYYNLTEIQIAPGDIGDCVVYEYDEQTSDVGGTQVTAGVFYGNENDGVALFMATFELEGISYGVKLHDSDVGESGAERLTKVVNELVAAGAPDMSVFENPAIPELRDERLELDAAHSDPDFGAYMPGEVPTGFAFESARRFMNQERNSLYAMWISGYDEISWSISKAGSREIGLVVSPGESEKYDMSLYSVPLADSVPEELREYVDCPVFRAEELTLEMIRARAYALGDSGDSAGYRMRFGVLSGEVIVEISAKGVTPEDVWQMLGH